MIKLKNEVEEFINTHCSKEKATYDEGLVSTSYEIKGLMNDDLVKFAKKLAVKKPKVNDFPLDYHEEIMLAGMTIAYSRMSPKEKAQELLERDLNEDREYTLVKYL